MKKPSLESLRSVGSLTGGRSSVPRLQPGVVAAPAASAAAFSLIEIMVTVGLLTFIVLGLVAMFGQTQRAFMTSMTQVDVLESGRAVTEMITRELAEVTPSHTPRTYNFVAEMQNPPFLQGLPGTADASGILKNRTNIFQRLFFLSCLNQDWLGVGYVVVPDYANAGVGALYRFSQTERKEGVDSLLPRFLSSDPATNGLSRIADGIVHFRLRAFAPNGFPLFRESIYTNAVFCTNAVAIAPNYRLVANSATSWSLNNSTPDLVNYYFLSNAVPAYLELELGVLESRTLERFRSIGTNDWTVQRDFLSNHVAQVHIFRQRIPVRNVDPSVYQ